MEALSVEGLTKDFGGVHAVRDVSFSVKAGKHLAIKGVIVYQPTPEELKDNEEAKAKYLGVTG